MNIEGLSEETLKKFLEHGFVENYPDLFRLEQHREEICEMEGFGEKSYTNLIESIEKAKETDLPRLIYALGINFPSLRFPAADKAMIWNFSCGNFPCQVFRNLWDNHVCLINFDCIADA